MQHRMKTHQLTKSQIEEILKAEKVGTLATINEDNSPYITPMHFVYENENIYIHGLPAGQKLDNIKRNPDVCFSVYHMDELLLDDERKPCDINIKYQSVIIQGKASILTEADKKKKILENIVEKYTPELKGRELPDDMVKGTAVIKKDELVITGKYWE